MLRNITNMVYYKREKMFHSALVDTRAYYMKGYEDLSANSL